jgi:hypothetical protein
MGNKHVHADLIKAWVDGADIECRIKGLSCWVDDNDPSWNSDAYEFRVKEPEEKKPVVRWLWADSWGYFPARMLTEDEAENTDDKLIKLEWSRTEFPE